MLEVLLFSIYLVGCSQLQPASAMSGDFMPICDQESDYSGSGSLDLPVPDLPEQFSFTIEGNLIERNSTAIVTEYYDGPGNRGRLELGRNGSSGIGIFDYNLGEIFLIPDFLEGDDCRVYPIADNLPRFLRRPFGLEHQNGTIHIGSPRTFIERLRGNDSAVTRYVDEAMVRGIPTQHWQACFNRENNSYLIDYYFATEDWNYEGQGQKLDSTQMVPVQFTLNATRIVRGKISNIYHIYTVVDFRAGPDSVTNSLFRIPNGLACTGRFSGQPVPQVPPFFSTYVQRVEKNSVHTYREFYDLPHKLFRIDVYTNGNRGGAHRPISIIHDFDTSVQYVVGKQIIYCSPKPLSRASPFFFDITIDDGGTLQLVSPNNFFFLGNEFNYSYEGVSNIRGVDVDSWVSVRDFEKVAGGVNLTDVIYEVFFTRPDWTYATDRSINTDSVPWRIKITGGVSLLNSTDNSKIKLNGAYQLDFFDFSTEEPPYDAFDISSCSAPDDFFTMVLIIPGQEKGIDLGQLKRNIRTSVSNYTRLRPLQIGNIQIVSENGSHIFVTFQISNLTSLAKIDPATNVTAQQAVDLITSNTIGSQLPFQIRISPSVSVTPSLHEAVRGPNVSKCDNTSCPVCGNCSNSNTTVNDKTGMTNAVIQTGISSGAVAGIALSLLILGIIIGVILQLTLGWVIRWFRSSGAAVNIGETVKYKKQEEDVSITN